MIGLQFWAGEVVADAVKADEHTGREVDGSTVFTVASGEPVEATEPCSIMRASLFGLCGSVVGEHDTAADTRVEKPTASPVSGLGVDLGDEFVEIVSHGAYSLARRSSKSPDWHRMYMPLLAGGISDRGTDRPNWNHAYEGIHTDRAYRGSSYRAMPV